MESARPAPCRGAWRRTVARLSSVCALALCLAAPAAALTASFTTSAEGWRITGDNAAAWSATGGNPAGCVYVNDLATGDMCYAVAPALWLGDWSALGAGDTLRVDLYLHNSSGGGLLAPEYIFRLQGPGGTAHALSGASYLPPDGVWTTYRVSLDPAAWVLDSGSWAALLIDVQSLRLMAEFVNGDEDVRFDNVSLTRSPVRQFDPCLVETFNDGTLGDWSFSSTGGLSNPGSGGNTRGFAQVNEGSSGTSYAYAPAAFLGDWSSLDGSGAIAMDVRMVGFSGAGHDAASFVRLSGPGGAAHAPLALSALSTSTRVWRTVSIPLVSSGWVVESGTWSGVLADVEECRIQTEFYDGSEKFGLDNFTRRGPACAAPDVPVTAVLPGSALCSTWSLVGATSPALNPADGFVYAMIEAASSSGGGLYPVSGPNAGLAIHGYESPSDVLFTSNGDAFISEDASGNIYRHAADGTASLWVSGFHSSDDDPAGMCVAPPGFDGPQVDPGDILVTDWGYSGPDEVWAFSPLVAEGERQVMIDPGNVDFQDIAAGDGIAYMADAADGSKLTRLSAAGTITTLALGTALGSLVSVAADTAAHRVFVADATAKAVYAIDTRTGAVDLAMSGFLGLQMCALAIEQSSRLLWVADTGANRVYQFCLPSLTAVAPPRDVPDAAPPALQLVATTAAGGVRLTVASARGGAVRLAAFDIAGRQVWESAVTLAAGGARVVRWDGHDAAGRAVAAGVYLLRAVSGDGASGRRVLLMP